jgi:hypothetical protein
MSDGSKISLSPITTLGRDPDQCNLAFPDDDQLSRIHARFEEQGKGWRLTDLGSTNGTFTNGQKITGTVDLHPGDQITLGRATYVFQEIGQISNYPAPNMQLHHSQGEIFSSGAQSLRPPVPNIPAGGWRSWQRPPLVEGFVRQVSDRYTMKKDDLVKRGVIAAALALLISPALSFLPFMQGSDIPVRDVRIEDYSTGQMADVKILGDIMGNINLGDAIAVWGKNHEGLFIMEAAYNYVTNTYIRIKK